MIGIGLLAFILAGAAFLLSYLDIWQRGWRQINETLTGPQLVFENGIQDEPSEGAVEVIFQRINQQGVILLSGLPAYQSASFFMPIDARPTSGHLQIDTTLQVLNGVEGALRVSINNQRRAEMLLRPGEATKSLQIPLTSEELAGGRLVVSFSLQGQGPTPLCGFDNGVEAIAEIETTSGLYLTLSGPIETPRDRVISWGNNTHIGWPKWLAVDEQPRRLMLGAELARLGQQVTFLGGSQTDAFSTTELRTFIETIGKTPTSKDAQLSWPISLLDNRTNDGVRRFTRETSWRYPYDIHDISDLTLPSALELSLLFGPLPTYADWTISVTLNGRLVHVDLVAGTTSSYVQQIALPFDYQSDANLVEVIVTSTFNPEGMCNDGPELIAEMRPETRLLGGAVIFNNPLLELKHDIANAGEIFVDVGAELSPPEATKAANLIGGVIASDTWLRVEGGNASITAVTRSTLATLDHVEPYAGERWLVFTDDETGKQAALRLTGADGEANSVTAPVALLVEFPASQGMLE